MERRAADGLASLLERFLAAGDEKAMEELVRRTRPRLLAAARRIAGPADAEDAVQTAYHSLLRKGDVPQGAPLMAWLLTAVVRVAYRHRATTRAQHELARRLAGTPRPATAESEDAAFLRAEIEHLPARYRDAVVLHYFEGLTAKEVGQLLGLTEAAIWQRLSRARLLLRSRLSPRLNHLLLAVPWWIADRAGAVSLLLGGTMKAKVAAAVLVVAIVGGGVALYETRDVATEQRAPAPPGRMVAEDLAPAAAEVGAERSPPAQVVPEKPRQETISQEVTDHLRDQGSSALRVRVVDDGGAARRGAHVFLSELTVRGAGRPVERETDAAGVASIDALRPGTWHLSVRAGDLLRSTNVDLVGGRMTDVRVVVLRAGAFVEGSVRDRASGPLPGVTVRLEARDASSSTLLSARTDAAGCYRFTGVPDGSYRVTVEVGGAARHCGRLEVAGDAGIRRDFEVGVLSLAGVVRDAATGLPIPDFPVRLQEPTSALCATDQEGSYRFLDLPAGKARLVLAKDGYEMLFVYPGELVPGERLTQDIALHPAAVLNVQVSDESGQAVSGKIWLRMCRDDSPSTDSSNLTADEEGRAVFRMIRPGRYDISVARADVESPSQKIEILDGENSARFQLQPALSLPMLSGMVRDAATGMPIEDVRVTAMSIQERTVTDEDGSFEFKRLTDAEQDLWIWKDGYAFKKVRTERLERGRTARVDVTLGPGATLDLSIVGVHGEPAQKPIFLHLTPNGGPAASGWSTPELDIDESGHAAYRSMPPGRYTVLVVSMEGSAKIEVDVPQAGASLAVRLR